MLRKQEIASSNLASPTRRNAVRITSVKECAVSTPSKTRRNGFDSHLYHKLNLYDTRSAGDPLSSVAPYGVSSVAVSAWLPVKEKVGVRLPSHTLRENDRRVYICNCKNSSTYLSLFLASQSVGTTESLQNFRFRVRFLTGLLARMFDRSTSAKCDPLIVFLSGILWWLWCIL